MIKIRISLSHVEPPPTLAPGLHSIEEIMHLLVDRYDLGHKADSQTLELSITGDEVEHFDVVLACLESALAGDA